MFRFQNLKIMDDDSADDKLIESELSSEYDFEVEDVKTPL